MFAFSMGLSAHEGVVLTDATEIERLRATSWASLDIMPLDGLSPIHGDLPIKRCCRNRRGSEG